MPASASCPAAANFVETGRVPKRMTGSILGFSLPTFWVGLMMIMVFSVMLGWLPSNGRGPTTLLFGLIPVSFLSIDGWKHLIMPATNLALFNLALLIRLTRSGAREALMYLGRVLESGSAAALFAAPNHPYTKALLTEVGKVVPRKRTFVPIKGEIPSPLDPPPGCHFHPRCPHAMPRCRAEVPELRAIAAGRLSACHLNDA